MQGLSIVEANMMIKGSNLDGQIGFIDFSLVNAVTEGAHVDDNQLMVENKRLLGTRVGLQSWQYQIEFNWHLNVCEPVIKDQKSFLEERNRQLEERLKLRRFAWLFLIDRK